MPDHKTATATLHYFTDETVGNIRVSLLLAGPKKLTNVIRSVGSGIARRLVRLNWAKPEPLGSNKAQRTGGRQAISGGQSAARPTASS